MANASNDRRTSRPRSAAGSLRCAPGRQLCLMSIRRVAIEASVISRGKNLMNLKHVATLLVAVTMFSLPIAAADYPTRAVSFIVPYAAGGATDQLARVLGQHLETKL